MPVLDTPAAYLAAAIASVRAQDFARWELCIVDDASVAPHVTALLEREAAADPRIRVARSARRLGIAAATNAALALAGGEFVALLDHDDELAHHALGRVAVEIDRYPDVAVLFSDEDKIGHGGRYGPYFKPGWNPDLLLGQNLVSHLGVYRRSLLIELGGLRENFEGSQDHDLALRATGMAGNARVRHIPEVLYHWRQVQGSFSAKHADQASVAGRRAVAEHLPDGCCVEPNRDLPQWTRIYHALSDPPPVVSIVVESGDGPSDPSYGALEPVRVASEAVLGSVLLFLAPGLVPHEPGWVREMASQAVREGVGAVGGRLDGPDGHILQAGLWLDPAFIRQTLHPGSDAGDPGYFGQFHLVRTVSAVSGACLAVRRDVFEAAGGFDARCAPYADIDFCLRLASQGLRCVWTPHARFRASGRLKVLGDRGAARLMRVRWPDALACDPYTNPNLAIRRGNLTLVCAAHRKIFAA